MIDAQPSGQETSLESNTSLHIAVLNPSASRVKPPLILLHGWGCNSDIWGEFPVQLASNQQYGLTDRQLWLVDLPGFGGSEPLQIVGEQRVLQILADNLPDKAILIGWSLGGMLATAYAAKWPERTDAVIAMGSNASYCQRADWPYGVPVENLGVFKKQLEDDQQQCLKRFRANQVRNDQQERQLLRQLTRLADKQVTPAWSEMLGLLEVVDNRAALRETGVNTLYLFGDQDLLVPMEAVPEIERLNSQIETEIFAGVSHALHLSIPEQIAERITTFLGSKQLLPCGQDHRLRNSLDKRLVRQSFGRSAPSYDSVAHLQRSVGEQLLSYLPAQSRSWSTADWVLDLGCGTGHFIRPLQQALCQQTLGLKATGQANFAALDLAEGMLQFARNKLEAEQAVAGNQWVCGDAEQLPLMDSRISLLFSNLALQWCEDLHSLAEELYRVLKPGGVAVLSTLGSQTLHEMRSAWQQVDDQVHVNSFVTVEEWRDSFEQQAFSRCKVEVKTELTHYPDVYTLSRELKALGAHNVNAGRPKGLTGRRRLKQFAEAYEPFRQSSSEEGEGLLPATWEVIYLCVEKSR